MTISPPNDISKHFFAVRAPWLIEGQMSKRWCRELQGAHTPVEMFHLIGLVIVVPEARNTVGLSDVETGMEGTVRCL